MKISKNNLDMLYRFALAEYFTSPTKAFEGDRFKAIEFLTRKALILHPVGGIRRVTEEGKEVLEEKLDRERLHLLHRVRERKVQVPK